MEIFETGGIRSITQGLSFVEVSYLYVPVFGFWIYSNIIKQEISLIIKDIVDKINMFKVLCKMDAISSGGKNTTISKTEWITKVRWFSVEDFGTEE